MYKKFFMGIAAMAALTLVSCSSEDLNSLSDNSSKGGAISFDGYCGRSAVSVNGSRGSVIDKAELQTKGFGVFGNYTATGDATAYGKNWFDNQKVTYKASAWTYEPLKYWLPQGHIDFLAYAPYDSEQKLNDNSKLNFTVNSTITEQKDLLWANAKDQTKDNIASTNNKVKFQFAHALSRLGYTVKLKEKYTGTTIKLTKITLAGSSAGTTGAFYTKGTIDLSYDLSNTSSSTPLWTTSKTDAKQKFDWFTGPKELTTAPSNNTEYLFVIPQDFSTSDKLYVIVEYTIEGPEGVTTPMKNTVYKQLNNEFKQGKAYTINLTIGLTPIEFDADVTGWDPTDDTSIEFDTWN